MMSQWIPLWAIPCSKLIYIPVEYKLEYIHQMPLFYLKLESKYLDELRNTTFSLIRKKNDVPGNIACIRTENPLRSPFPNEPTKSEVLITFNTLLVRS